jgi:ABC-type multidrug transport system ATPase subunit
MPDFHKNEVAFPGPSFIRRKGGIGLFDIGKRFNREWIFRHVNYQFEIGRSYAITGPNGSGKSTLLQAIAGSLHLSEGRLAYNILANDSQEAGVIDPEKIYQYLAISAPYLEVIEEMTAREFLSFHGQFKPMLSSISIDEIFFVIGLEKSADKQIRYFSSGMKQRIKLAQAIFSAVPVLLLDEPCTNLDTSGYQLYHTLITDYCSEKLIIVSSNDAMETDFCTERLNILDYK